MWNHVIQTAIGFPGGPVEPCRWPILTATVMTRQNKVSIRHWTIAI